MPVADRSLVIESQKGKLFSPAVLHIFDKGSTTPMRTVIIPLDGNDFVRVRGGAFDAAGNLFLSVDRYPTPGGMFEVPAGSSQAVQIATDPGFGEAFDAAGNLYVSFGSAIVQFDHETQHVTRLITDGLARRLYYWAVQPVREFWYDSPMVRIPRIRDPNPASRTTQRRSECRD